MEIFLNFILLFLAFFTCSAQKIGKIKLENSYSPYNIQDSIAVRTRDGATRSLITVRKKGDNNPKPAMY